MDYKMAVKVKNFLKKNDPVEFSDTFGDNDPEDFTAIDVILKNNNKMVQNWLKNIGTPKAITLMGQIK